MTDESTPRDPVRLVGRRHWAGLWFGIAVMGSAFGVTMVTGGAWAGWFLIICFMPSAAVLGYALRPEANELVIDLNGFVVRSSLRSTTTPWSDVEAIGVIDVLREQRVALRYTTRAAAAIPEAAEIAAGMAGYHRTLPMTYGVDAEDLATLMRRYFDAR